MIVASTSFVHSAFPAEQKLVIGYTGAPSTVDYWNKLRGALHERAKSLEVVLIDFPAGDFSLERQAESIRQAIAEGVDGLIVGPVSNRISDTIDILRDANIPVVVVGVPVENDWVASTVATDNSGAARLAGRFLRDRLADRAREGSRVVVLCGDTVQVDAVIRAAEPEKILKEAGYVVGVHFSKWWSAKISLQQAIEEFSKHGDSIVGGFSCFADGTIAMVEAAEAFNLSPVMVGFDLDENMRSLIAAGRLAGAVTQYPAMTGQIGLELIVDLLRGKEVPALVGVPAQLVTRDNVHKF